jgi:hypothetical protein
MLKEIKYIVLETGFYSLYTCDKNFDAINSLLKSFGFNFVASNVSGPGWLPFFLMRARGIFYNFRRFGIKGLKAYSGFFDVLYLNSRF